jgi:hypothetical protein
MQTALKMQQTWTPQVPHTVGVVLTSVVLTVLVIALLVVTGLLTQDFMGGVQVTGPLPEPGLDL